MVLKVCIDDDSFVIFFFFCVRIEFAVNGTIDVTRFVRLLRPDFFFFKFSLFFFFLVDFLGAQNRRLPINRSSGFVT